MSANKRFLNEINAIEHLENIFNTDKWTILKEEPSTFPYAKAILDCIFLYMRDHMEESLILEDDGGKLYQFHIPFSAFKMVGTFFSNIDLLINCYEKKTHEVVSPLFQRLYYKRDMWMFEFIDEQRKLTCPTIVINYTAENGQIYYDGIAPIMHQFLFAYEDYNYICHKKDLLTYVQGPIEQKMNEKDSKHPKPYLALKNMMIFCSKEEKEKLIAKSINEAKELLEEYPEYNTKKSVAIIKKLSIYKIFRMFDNELQHIWNMSEEQRNSIGNILDYVMRIGAKNKLRYFSRMLLMQEEDIIIEAKLFIRGKQKYKFDKRKKGYYFSVLNYRTWQNRMEHGKEV